MARLGEEYGAFMGQVVADRYYHVEGAGPGRLVTGVVVIDVGRGPDLGVDPPPEPGRYNAVDFVWRYLAKRPRGATVKDICAGVGTSTRATYDILQRDPRFVVVVPGSYPAIWGLVRDDK